VLAARTAIEAGAAARPALAFAIGFAVAVGMALSVAILAQLWREARSSGPVLRAGDVRGRRTAQL